MSDAFDVEGARKAGYSDAEIADYLGSANKFDVGGARKAGYGDAEILSHLMTPPTPEAPAAAPVRLYSGNPDAPTSYGGPYTAPTPRAEPSKIDALAKDAVSGLNTGVNYLGTQFTKGLTGLIGAPKATADINQRAIEWAAEKLGVPETGKVVGKASRTLIPGSNFAPDSDKLNKYIFGNLAPEVNSPSMPFTFPGTNQQGDLGKIIDAGVQAVPAMMAGPMGGLAKMSPGAQAAATAIPAIGAGATSETAGQATAGTPWEIPARLFGGLSGAYGGTKAVTPLPAKLTPNELRAVEIAKSQTPPIPMTLGQETGRLRGLETAMERFPTSSGPFDKLRDVQAQGGNRAAIAETGAIGDRTDPQSMRDVYRQASDKFEQAKQTSGPITLTPENFYNPATAAVGTYHEATNPASIIPLVQKQLEGFYSSKLMKEGSPYPQLSGEQYQEFRRTLGNAIQSTRDSGASNALKGIRNALDDAMGESLPPEKAAAWKEVRRNWANLKVLLKAASGGTSDSRAEGNISPNALNSALRQSQGPDKFATTTGGLNDIGHMNAYLSDTFPNSWTPTAHAYHGLISGGAGLAAGALGVGEHAGMVSPGVAVPGAAALIAPNLLARGMTGQGVISGPIRNYLANQTMTRAFPGLYGGRMPLALAPSIPRLEDRRQ